MQIKAYHKFQNIGMKDVEIKLYPKLRHDILHEKCKKEIYEYVYNWIEKKLK